MNVKVGEVIAVNGTKVSVRLDEDSNRETLFFNGERFRGVSIREYIAIRRGFRDIICMVEGEYLDERKVESGARPDFVRRIDVKPIGHYTNKKFAQGIKYMPMIRDQVFLVSEEVVGNIFGGRVGSRLSIGRLLKEEIEVGLPWQKLFNSHIGIFGNTGSGKSNTLAKLYTVVLNDDTLAIEGKSSFFILDFNGEYTGAQIVSPERKAVYRLSTHGDGTDKFPIHENEFWDSETLSVLFQATRNTQRPFLNRLVDGKKKYDSNVGSLAAHIKATFKRGLASAHPRPDSLDLLRRVAGLIGASVVEDQLQKVSWHSGQQKFYVPSMSGTYFDADGAIYDAVLSECINDLSPGTLDAFDQLIIRAHLQLVNELSIGHVQFDHIQPLIKRMESSVRSLRKVIHVGSVEAPVRMLSVISMRRCNNEVKKVFPLILAKHFYETHKDVAGFPPDRTAHLIIDEAHNILSQQSAREQEGWRDYRLELFEEIVKEGRKFGFFLTVSSQRPADISPTIISQLHNFFIHRLINERDLQLIDNTITTLDSISKSLIPGLAQGSCVATGTAFDVPMLMQVDPLASSQQPDSQDIDLEVLWR